MNKQKLFLEVLFEFMLELPRHVKTGRFTEKEAEEIIDMFMDELVEKLMKEKEE